MATDQFGNYVCDIQEPTFEPASSGKCCRIGDGPPDDADGNDGQYYVDNLNEDFYFKTDGAWKLVVGAGGAAGIIGDVSPEGVVTADAGTLYADKTHKTFWIKETGNGTAFGWQQYV